ncbi:MAG: ABC transporter permease [Acidobacteria bacterium]|nr:ABC transporter permease [Acidobacteriota bacterium]
MNLFQRALKNKQLVVGSVLGLVVLALGAFGPLIFGAYDTQDLLLGHKPVGTPGFPFGTDALGRDLAARATYGIRISLFVAVSVTAIAVVLGTTIGLIAGYVKGAVDTVTSWIVDFVWGFPLILVAVLAAASIGSGLVPVILAVGLVNTVAIARVVRGEVLGISEREFVVAAKAGGYSSVRIVFRHIVPNVIPVALVLSSYYVAVSIIAEASLSFVGLGAQPPLPSLGQMVSDGRNFIRLNHWEATIPGAVIFVMVLSVSLIGDGLRDLLDPRLRTAVERASAT